MSLLESPEYASSGAQEGYTFFADISYLNRYVKTMDASLHGLSVSPVLQHWNNNIGFSWSLPLACFTADTEDYGQITGFLLTQQFNVSYRIIKGSEPMNLYYNAGIMNTVNTMHYDVHMINNQKTVYLFQDQISFHSGFTGQFHLSDKIKILPSYSFRYSTYWPRENDYIYSTRNFQEVTQKSEWGHLIGVDMEIGLICFGAQLELKSSDGYAFSVNTRIPLFGRPSS